MSVGAAAVTAILTTGAKRLTFSGESAWFRNLLTLTLSGHSGSPANYVFLVYRGSTLVALAQTPTGAVFSLDTNTAEMEDFFPNNLGIGEPREFQVYLYNADPTSLELLGLGILTVHAVRDYAETAPIPPLSATTVFIGSFAFYNGKTYLRDTNTGKYHEFAAYSIGGTVTDALESEGIEIPGAPAL
jgi:hypothetical protein